MKKNISQKEGLLKWLKMTEEQVYNHPEYKDQNHPETKKMLAAYDEYCNGGKMAMGGYLPKYELGSTLPVIPTVDNDGNDGNGSNIPEEKLLGNLQGELGGITDTFGKDSKVGKATKFLGKTVLPFTGVAGAAGALGVGALIALDQRSQRKAADRLEAKTNFEYQQKNIINNYVSGDRGEEAQVGMRSGGNLPQFPMNKMLIAMQNGGRVNPQYIMAGGGNIEKIVNKNVVDIGGEYHEGPNGGTNVNSVGQPLGNDAPASTAKAQKGETSLGNYIFSNDLGLDKDGNPTGNVKDVAITYAAISKKNDKMFGRKKDPLGMRTNEFVNQQTKSQNDMSLRLKAEADQQKVEQAFSRFSKKYGGLIQYTLGGDQKPWGQLTPYEKYTSQNHYSSYQKPNGNITSPWKQNYLYGQYSGNPGVTPSTGTGTAPNIFAQPRDTRTFDTAPYNRGLLQNGYNPNGPTMPRGINPDSEEGDQPSGVPLQPPYQYPQPTEKEYRDRELFDAIAQGNIWNGGIPNPNQSTSGKDDYPYVQGYEYNKQPGWGTNPQVTPPIPNQVMFGQEPKSSKTETPIQDNTDYAGLGLSTIAPLINFAYGTKKDDNNYYDNQRYAMARQDINNMRTDVNIDANLAANNRDFRASAADANRRSASVGNSVASQMLSNKMNVNNAAYQDKYNTENQLKSAKQSALANLDYTSGEADRRERIAREDKNQANRARREDMQLGAIKDASANLNTMRNDKTGLNALNSILKYSTYDTKTGKFVPKANATALQIINIEKINKSSGETDE